MAIYPDGPAATAAEPQCVFICRVLDFRFAHSAGGVLGFLPWFRLRRPHSTDSNDPTPPDRAPHAYPSPSSEPQPLGPEPESPTPRWTEGPKDDTIKKLMLSPTLFDPIRTPRYPIVLCHGWYSTIHTWWHCVYIGKLQGCTDLTFGDLRRFLDYNNTTGITSLVFSAERLAPR